MLNFQKNIKYIFFSLIILCLIALTLSLKLPLGQSFRIAFGGAYLLFLPGLVWTFVLFKKEIDFIERIIISSSLSIAGVPLIIFWLYKLGLKINKLSVFLVTLGIITIGLVICFSKQKSFKKI